MSRSVLMLILSMFLAACGVIGGDDDSGGGDAGEGGANVPIITWDESPDTIVFRADYTGGVNDDSFLNRNDIPPCTIYGDNRIVWPVDGESGTDVLFDIVDPELIRGFVTDLTVTFEIYTYETGADLSVPSSESPLVERLTLAVNDTEHVTDSLGGWDVDYFEDAVNRCQDISQAPAVFEPDAVWVSALEVEYDPGSPVIPWDADAADLDLIEIANSGERVWVRGQLARILWNVIRSSAPDIQFSQGASTLYVAVEVPNVTGQSPPAPSESSEE